MSNTYDYYLTLDLSGANPDKYIYAKQGDKNSRKINITLMNGDEPNSFAEGDAVSFRCKKPSGYICYNPAILNNDGTVIVVLTEQSLAEVGLVLADIAIIDGNGETLSSTSFYIRVNESGNNGEHIESTNEMLVLDKLIEDANKIVDEYNGTLDAVTPSIGENGNWYVGGNDTGVPSRGEDGQDGQDGQDGSTPYIGENGNWWIDGVDTGKPSAGQVDMTEVHSYVDEVASTLELKKLQFEDTVVPVSAFVDNTEYPEAAEEGYTYMARVPLSGVISSMIPEVTFGAKAAPIMLGSADAYNGGIILYANSVPDTDITIPTILLWRGSTGTYFFTRG